MENNDNNNSLDDFIKKRLEQINPKFEEVVWDKMEYLLDEQFTPKKSKFTWNTYFLLSLFLVFALFTGISYLNKFPVLVKRSEEARLNYNAKQQSVDTKNIKVKKNEKQRVSKNSYKKSKTKKEIPDKSKKNKKVFPNVRNNKYSSKLKQKEENSDIIQNKVYKARPNLNHFFEEKKNNLLTFFSKPNKVDFLKTHTLMKHNRVPYEVIESPILERTNKFKDRLYLGLLISPEYSQVELTQEINFDVNIGVLLRIWTVKNLQIQSGLIYNQKHYTTQQFEPIQTRQQSARLTNFISNNVRLLENSRVKITTLEIPVDVLYTFFRKNRLEFFIGLGFSNYLILNQKFEHDVLSYKGNSDDFRVFSETINIEDTQDDFQAFRSLNMQVGANFYINSKLYLSLSPYYNLNLRGIGSEKANLDTNGLRFVLFKKF